MKNKKSIIIVAAAALLVITLAVTAIVLVKNLTEKTNFDATVVDIEAKKELIKDYIIDWDSSTKEHDTLHMQSDTVCSISVENENESFYFYQEYNTFQEGWAATQSEELKNKGNLIFVFHADWVVDVDNWGPGIFGHDEHEEGTVSIGEIAFINAIGGLLIKNWTKNFTIDFNGYKIDGKCQGKSHEDGTVIKIDECDNVYLKNGCITGGATDSKGGGLLVYGESCIHLENMTITGNYAGTFGGGIYFGDHTSVSTRLTNTTIEGNYSQGYGGGVYCAHDSDTLDVHLNLYGKVIIQNNIGLDNRNNLTFECESDNQSCSHVGYVELLEGSSIYLSFSRLDSTTRAIVDSGAYSTEYDVYFHADDSDWNIYSDVINNQYLFGQGLSRYALLMVKKGGCN